MCYIFSLPDLTYSRLHQLVLLVFLFQCLLKNLLHFQDDNPARERTIVRTAEKLKPFGFNKFVENKYHEFIPSRLRCKFQNTNNGESDLAEVFCTFCMSPLSESELHDMHGKSHTLVDTCTAACCQSCSFQILPKESGSLQHFLSFLPQSMTRKVADSTSEQSLLR